MTEVTYRQAVATALAEELDHDQDVVLLGEDIGAAGGVFKATKGLFDRFGPDRVRDTPISEQAIIGCAMGAAMTGLRPVAELMFADFAGVCFDQLANQLAKHRYMTGGQVRIPVTVRLATGAGIGFGAQHSQSSENWFLNIPGLKLCVPGTPADAYGLLKAAIRDDNPVLVFEHKGLYSDKGELPKFDEVPAIGQARVRRSGGDVTIVGTQLMCQRALAAAEQLASEDGIDAEVIDLRTLAPLDTATVFESVGKTSRLVCVQECSFNGSWGASLVGAVAVEAFDLLDAPPLVIGGDETPIPFAAGLEAAWLPSADRIVALVREALNG
jgi:pyruvate dehydrogenase E1 component beta subunit